MIGHFLCMKLLKIETCSIFHFVHPSLSRFMSHLQKSIAFLGSLSNILKHNHSTLIYPIYYAILRKSYGIFGILRSFRYSIQYCWLRHLWAYFMIFTNKHWSKIIKGTHRLMYSPNSLNQKADVLPFHLRVFQFRALREMQQLFNILLRVRFVLF